VKILLHNSILRSGTVIFFVALMATSHGQTEPLIAGDAVQRRFGIEFKAASDFCSRIYPSVNATAGQYLVEPEMILAIGFPECLRYSVLCDRMETYALETIYVSFGREKADFSIGVFQMKPSFAEDLEATVFSDSSLARQFEPILNYANQGCFQRLERVARLKTVEWQILYLCCFYKVMERKAAGMAFPEKSDRLRFYASAYNHGFLRPAKEIEKWQHAPTFPGGRIDPVHHFPYCEVSKAFYTTFKPKK
jgi:hypothetical protein